MKLDYFGVRRMSFVEFLKKIADAIIRIVDYFKNFPNNSSGQAEL